MKSSRHFFLLFTAFLMIGFSLTAKPRFKKLNFKVGDGYLIYEGYAEKKIPMGKGVLTIYMRGTRDRISGIFNDQEVSDATLLSSVEYFDDYIRYSTKYNGSLSFDYSENEISYTLMEGSFVLNEIILADGSTAIPVKNLIVKKTWNGRILSPEEYKFEQLFKPQIEPFGEELSGLIIKITGMPPKVTECREYSFDLVRNSLKGPYPEYGHMYILEFDGSASGKFTPEYLAIRCDNGDSLVTKHNYTDMLRHVGNGIIEYHGANDHNFEYTSEYSGGYLISPLRDEILKQMPLEYYSMLDSLDNLGIKNRISEQYYQDLIPWEETLDNTGSHAVEVTYSNGDKYVGSLYCPRDVKDDRYYLLNLDSLPKEEEYYWGLYSTGQGEKRFYIDGYAADTLRIKFDQRVREKRIAKEKEEQEYLASRAAIEKEFYEKKTQLERKYGKKYVDSIYDSNDILIGTPLALLEDYYLLFASTKTQARTSYEVYKAGVFLHVVWIDNATHKVVKVGY